MVLAGLRSVMARWFYLVAGIGRPGWSSWLVSWCWLVVGLAGQAGLLLLVRLVCCRSWSGWSVQKLVRLVFAVAGQAGPCCSWSLIVLAGQRWSSLATSLLIGLNTLFYNLEDTAF